MILIQNEYILDNLNTLLNSFAIAFIIGLFITPLIGRIAKLVGAVDLPASMRASTDTASSSRINREPKLQLGGLAIAIAFFGAVILTGSLKGMNIGILIGILIILLVGVLDDKFELSGKVQLFGQALAALVVIFSGISVVKISFLGTIIDFDWASYLIEFGNFSYNFIFPADILTLIWIVGVINFINWVGGVDGLNTAVSAIISGTLALLALDNNHVVLATILIAHVGALMGYFPFNYNPSKIIQGTTGDLFNGYLISIFAIIGGTRWTSTFVILALPLLDAFFVILMRIKAHPEALKNPLKLLSISDTNHLHHRLMSAGYNRKSVLFLETSMMTIIAAIAVYFSGIRRDVVSFIVGLTIIFVFFSVVYFLKNKNKIKPIFLESPENSKNKEEAVVKVIFQPQKNQKEEGEKFIY